MSGVLFYLGTSACPLSSSPTTDVDDTTIQDKYELMSCDDDDNDNVKSNLELSQAMERQLDQPPRPFTSPIDYLASHDIAMASNVKYESPSATDQGMVRVNLDPPSPLLLSQDEDDFDDNENEDEDEDDDSPHSLLSSSASSLATDPPTFTPYDMAPIISAYKGVSLIDDDIVHDRFVDLMGCPLMADPERPTIPTMPMFERVSDLLKTFYPELQGEDYAYHLKRLRHNRNELHRLRKRLENDRPVRCSQLQDQLPYPSRRSRVKLH